MPRDPTFYVKIASGCQILTVTALSEEDAGDIMGSVVSAWASGEPVVIDGRRVLGSSGGSGTVLALNPALVSSVGIEVYVPGVREW